LGVNCVLGGAFFLGVAFFALAMSRDSFRWYQRAETTATH
jgi:hypothetical protein